MQYQSNFVNPALSSDLKAIRIIPGTKVTHDRQGDMERFFPYSEVLKHNIPAAIPCKPNGIVIIDVDVPGPTHKHDGTQWWKSFVQTHGIPATYTVATPSGGFHFYYRLPDHVKDTFAAPGSLALGVDVKWDGYGICPPTNGYQAIFGDLYNLTIVPPALLAEMENARVNNVTKQHHATPETQGIRKTFSDEQVTSLKTSIQWIQQNAVLTRDQWRDGIFSIKAGAFDRMDLAEELVTMWSYNKSYVPGDEAVAVDMLHKADEYGNVGPGTIFAIIKEIMQAHGHELQTATFGLSLFDIATQQGLHLDHDKKGRAVIEPSESNVSAIVSAILPPQDLYYDVRQDLYVYKGQVCDEGAIVNSVIPAIQHPTSGFGLGKFRKNVIQAGIETLLFHRQVDPHKDFLKRVQWDGVHRLDKFFSHFFGVPDNEYHSRLGKNFWAALAARGLNPGVKFDSVLILEGGEGIRKSSFVEFVGGEYTYVPSEDHPFKSLDCLRQMHQSVVVELPELIGLIGESSEVIKARLAQPYDNLRSLYAKKATKRLRGFIFIGTTNSSIYLNETDGVRRFWPLKIPPHLKSLDLETMKLHREQLFAEGKELYQSGYDFWFMPENLLTPIVREKQHGRSFNHFLTEITLTLGSFTTLQIFNELAKNGIVSKKLTTATELRIKQGLEEIGFELRYEQGLFLWARKQDPVKDLFKGLL